jgi:hypothetical protein
MTIAFIFSVLCLILGPLNIYFYLQDGRPFILAVGIFASIVGITTFITNTINSRK